MAVKLRAQDLEALRAKERAHDQYLAATQQMRRRSELLLDSPDVPAEYKAGWKACLREWRLAIVDAMGDER